ncbi:MAG TPA: hypothetical protein VHI13_16680 [Candidatus Kapabacteria bacterium]|nr:hypothetical protein [Candidatus Kapabacteria bacterium]
MTVMLEPHIGRRLSERAIHKRKGIERFVLDLISTSVGGRPAKLYSVEAVKLWLGSQSVETTESAPAKPKRSRRSDCSQPRKCTPEEWLTIVTRVKGIYLSNAQANLRLACEEAVWQLTDEGMVIKLNVYRRLFNKNRDKHTGLYLSEFWRDNWRALHTERWYKLRHRHNQHTNSLDRFAFFENAGWAGGPTDDRPGFGAGRVWVIDGRSSDAWARTSDSRDPRSMKLPNALYIRCGLTGYPLWIEPIENESADAVKTALLKCMMYWRRTPDIAVATDGGIAMTAEDTTALLSLLLPDEAWDRAIAFPDFFGHKRPSPVMLNAPYMPNSMFKGMLERGNKEIKDEHDATRHPSSYQGGNRSEAVQIRVTNQPVVSADAPLLESYFDRMMEWVRTTYIHRERPKSELAHVERYGLPPTYEAAFTYYGGHTEAEELPRDERLAMILYWFTLRMPDRQAVGRAKGAGVTLTRKIGGEAWPVVCSGITFRHQGEKMCVVPIPGDPVHAVVLHLLNGDERKPQYVGIGIRTRISDPTQIGYQRAATTANRKRYLAEIQAEIKATPKVRFENHPHTPIGDDREVPTWLDAQAANDTPQLPEHISALPADDEPMEISDDVYKLLRRTNSLH